MRACASHTRACSLGPDAAEGLALLPALDPDRPDDYFLFIANDNDFATTDGFHAGAAYKRRQGP